MSYVSYTKKKNQISKKRIEKKENERKTNPTHTSQTNFHLEDQRAPSVGTHRKAETFVIAANTYLIANLVVFIALRFFGTTMVSYPLGKLALDYPIYGSKFLNESTLLVVGGGGEGNHGIPNKITACTVDFNRTKIIKRFRELPLKEDQDAPTCLDSNNNVILFSCNESSDSIKSGQNRHLRKYGYISNHLRFIQDAQISDSADPTEYTKAVSLSEDGSVACLSSSQNGRIFIISTDKLDVKFDIDTKVLVKDLCISSDGKILAYLTQTSLEFISTVTGKQIASHQFPDVSVSKVRFASDNNRVIIAAALKKSPGLSLIEYSLDKKAIIRQKIVSKKTRGVTCMAFSNGLIALGGNDTSIILVKRNNFSVVKQFPKVHSFAITTVQISPSGQYLASTSADNSISVFKLPPNLATSSSFFVSLFTKLFGFVLVILLGILIQWLVKERVINDLIDYYKREMDSSNYFTIQPVDISSSSEDYELTPASSVSSIVNSEETEASLASSSYSSTIEQVYSTISENVESIVEEAKEILTGETSSQTYAEESSTTSSTVSSALSTGESTSLESSSTSLTTISEDISSEPVSESEETTVVNSAVSTILSMETSSSIDSSAMTTSASTEVITPGPSDDMDTTTTPVVSVPVILTTLSEVERDTIVYSSSQSASQSVSARAESKTETETTLTSAATADAETESSSSTQILETTESIPTEDMTASETAVTTSAESSTSLTADEPLQTYVPPVEEGSIEMNVGENVEQRILTVKDEAIVSEIQEELLEAVNTVESTSETPTAHVEASTTETSTAETPTADVAISTPETDTDSSVMSSVPEPTEKETEVASTPSAEPVQVAEPTASAEKDQDSVAESIITAASSEDIAPVIDTVAAISNEEEAKEKLTTSEPAMETETAEEIAEVLASTDEDDEEDVPIPVATPEATKKEEHKEELVKDEL